MPVLPAESERTLVETISQQTPGLMVLGIEREDTLVSFDLPCPQPGGPGPFAQLPMMQAFELLTPMPAA